MRLALLQEAVQLRAQVLEAYACAVHSAPYNRVCRWYIAAVGTVFSVFQQRGSGRGAVGTRHAAAAGGLMIALKLKESHHSAS